MKNYVIMAALAISSVLSAQTNTEIAAETVNKSEIEGHIYFLADDVLTSTMRHPKLFFQKSSSKRKAIFL